MALLLTSVFGVTGCGSDEDVQVESRVKNAAPEASGVSDGPSEADCDLLELDRLDRIVLLNLRNLLYRLDLLDLLDRLDLDMRDFDRLYDLLDQCDATSDSGADAPEGDDVDGG